MHDARCYKSFLFLALYFILTAAWSQTPPLICDATAENPCLVQDAKNQQSPINWLRDASKISGAYQGNTLGINELFISGSEEPSEQAWKEIAAYITKRKPKEDIPVIVLDLRQESHGYINGRPITIADKYNWLNLGKSNAQTTVDQEAWLSSLRAQKTVENVLTSKQFGDKDFANGKSITVLSIQNEEYFVNKLGYTYHRIYMSDHRAPRDAEVDDFVALVKSAPKEVWFHAHCRGGKGRTTTIFAMYDMLKNADKVSFQEIISRQASIPPYYNLFELHRGDPFLTPYYEQRIVFLAQFYEFARYSLLGFEGSWSEWKVLNNLKSISMLNAQQMK